MKLFLSAITKYLLGVLLVGFLLFLPAGSLSYSGGWLLMSLLFGPMLLAGLVMFIKSPVFLEKRLDAKEKQATQKGVLKFAALMFIGSFVVAGLDWRFGWSKVSLPVTGIASVLFLGAYGLYAEVMRENAYLSRTIKVEEGQKVVDTGLYGIVRHPMYSATLLLFLAIMSRTPNALALWNLISPVRHCLLRKSRSIPRAIIA